ncbi:MAG: hypothetical protein R3F21_09790 [Myxococcota bacterium]
MRGLARALPRRRSSGYDRAPGAAPARGGAQHCASGLWRFDALAPEERRALVAELEALLTRADDDVERFERNLGRWEQLSEAERERYRAQMRAACAHSRPEERRSGCSRSGSVRVAAPKRSEEGGLEMRRLSLSSIALRRASPPASGSPSAAGSGPSTSPAGPADRIPPRRPGLKPGRLRAGSCLYGRFAIRAAAS